MASARSSGSSRGDLYAVKVPRIYFRIPGDQVTVAPEGTSSAAGSFHQQVRAPPETAALFTT